jgi:hypothetical protein
MGACLFEAIRPATLLVLVVGFNLLELGLHKTVVGKDTDETSDDAVLTNDVVGLIIVTRQTDREGQMEGWAQIVRTSTRRRHQNRGRSYVHCGT